MHEISIIYTTVSSLEEAEKLAIIAVEAKLAACVNIFPNITSIYQWVNEIKKESEYAVLFKTTQQNEDNLLNLIKNNHPYSVPAIIVANPNTTPNFYAYIEAQTSTKIKDIKQQPLLSHVFSTENISDTIEKIASRIKQEGDKPYASIQSQLELLEQLSQFEFGQFLLLNKGINGYWTHYMLTHPWFGLKTQKKPSDKKLPSLEQFVLNKAPSILATQQRFELFLQENQKEVKNEAKLACIPCGMMGELLYLNFKDISNIKLIGIDYDPNTLNDAKFLAEKQGLLPWIELNQGNAWEINYNNEFDLISSNGLNIYEADDQRVTQLYGKFYNALKQGGKLVTSFITPPPNLSGSCEWNMSAINHADLLKQNIIFSDILQAKWQCYRDSAQTKKQLTSVGFNNIEFIYDPAKLFPTVIAYKN